MTIASSQKRVVLLVDDEVIIRMLALDALLHAGFEVIEAADADEALGVLESGAEGVHLLFTDINMPGAMDGLQLAHHVCRNWSWIRVLIASGKTQPADHEMPPGSRFLVKPYELHHVVAHARSLTTV